VRDVAIVSFAQAEKDQPDGQTETAMLLPTITRVLETVGLTRKDVGFTCSGSADYLSGGVFTFVQTLSAAGAWPPIAESHVEMDGAWALYEAWVRLQHDDVDVALVYSSGKNVALDFDDVLNLQTDPYYLMPLCTRRDDLAALQAQAMLARSGRTEKDLAEVAARCRRSAVGNPIAEVSGEIDAAELLAAEYTAAPLRAHDCSALALGAAAVVLVAGDRAREVCERPAWIRGIDHRVDPHYPGVRDLSVSPSAKLAAARAGVADAPVEVAELCASYTHEELLLRDALGLGDEVSINPSGGALVSNPPMVAGLTRIGEAFRQIHDHGRRRTLGHASSGPCLQQNLVCVLEAE
jgi:acetyl-CoA acetyltransferase